MSKHKLKLKYACAYKVKFLFLISREYYYAVMRWTSGNELFIQWLNRAQNETVCMTYGPESDTGKIVSALIQY